MPTVPENTPSSTTTTNGVDCEPDDDWKENLRKRIEEGLQSMVADAKENHATELSKAPDTTEARIRLEADYKDAMQTIKSLASEQYKIELERERNQRRWTAGVPMTPGWSQYFHQEQQNIMNSIKQSNQTDNSVRTASESPTEERRSAIPKPSNEPPALAPTTTPPVLLPVHPSPPVRSAGERQSVRRGSDVRTSLSGDHDDSGSFRRSHHASVHVRPRLPDNWVATETVDEPEELLRSPPPRARVPSIDRPSQPSSVSPDIRWDGSLGRSSGSIHSAEPRSPPRAPPEVWKPVISPAEDALPPHAAKPYNLGRRESTTSMRSTGSGASIRPSITETIPERADDGSDESDVEENDCGRVHETVEQVRPRISTTTTTDRSRAPPPEVWKPVISPPDDAHPRPPASKPYNLGRRGSATSMRSTGSGTSIRPSMTETIPEWANDDGSDESDIEENDYGRVHEAVEQVRPWISSTTADRSRNKPHLRRNSRQSSVDADLGSSSLRSDDRHRPIDSPGKPPPPYYDYRDQSSPRDSYTPHRDHQPPPQDPRSTPATTRSSFGGDDRDYGTQYSSTPHRPHGPKPPPYFPQRESRPISRQVSFTRQLHLDLDDDNDERDIIDRERYRDREYDRDRDRDGGGREIHSATAADPRRPSTTTATYPYSASSRHSSSSSSYPNNPSTTTPGGSSRPVALQDYDVHEDWEGGPGPRYNYRGPPPPPPPDNSEYHQRRPESARPGPGGLSRQSSYVRPPPPPRDDSDRRYSGGDNDRYSSLSSSRHFSTTTTGGGGGGVGGIPIPRNTQSLDEQQPLSQLQQQPAWRDWAAEGNRHPNYDYHQQQARSPPPPPNVVESSFPPPRRFAAAPTTATHPLPPSQQLYSDDDEDDDDDDVDVDEDDADVDDDDADADDDDVDVDDDDSSEEGIEAKRLRDLEARKHMLEENRREADDELRRMELEIQQLAGEEARKRKEEEEKREDMRRKEEEAKRREEEARKKEAEIWKMEEEMKRKEEEAARKAEELKRMEEVAKKKEADATRKEKDARKKEEAARRKVEEARRKAEELNKKEEEAKQREARLEQYTEKTKQMQLETQKIAEDLKKKEEEARRKDLEMKEREDVLRRREEELIRREAENFRREQEAREKEKEEARKKQEEEARKKEELEEKVRKDEEVKRDAMKRKEEMRKEKARQEEAKREEMRKMEEAIRAKARQEEEEVRREETRKREEAFMEAEREETRKRAVKAKREEENMKRKLEAEEAKRKTEEAAKRKEEDSRRREEARFEGFRREQEEKRLQNESQHLDDMFIDLDPSLVDSKLMDEQLKVLQQAEFRKRVDDIRRTREERKRNDSVGNDNAWPNPSYPSNSPGTSPSMSKSPHYNGPPIPERSAGSSASSWGAGAPAWGPSIKPTATASSPTASRSSTSTSTGKPRTGSVSSGTYPTSSSPRTASFSEAERTRKQQEFAESQQEQFRREQEKLEAERQLKSAGRPLSREELQRVFEHHERLWTRLNTLNELSWNDFPWPMAKQPSNPDDMSLPQISAYIQSPLYPDKDKTRTPKDRIKELIKRWHPDRFETKLLPKVVENEREKVKHGAGNIARYLSDLLRKENESNLFGE